MYNGQGPLLVLLV